MPLGVWRKTEKIMADTRVYIAINAKVVNQTRIDNLKHPDWDVLNFRNIR